jgi:hypothetical protein
LVWSGSSRDFGEPRTVELSAVTVDGYDRTVYGDLTVVTSARTVMFDPPSPTVRYGSVDGRLTHIRYTYGCVTNSGLRLAKWSKMVSRPPEKMHLTATAEPAVSES